jgi:hypothetical protein
VPAGGGVHFKGDDDDSHREARGFLKQCRTTISTYAFIFSTILQGCIIPSLFLASFLASHKCQKVKVIAVAEYLNISQAHQTVIGEVIGRNDVGDECHSTP